MGERLIIPDGVEPGEKVREGIAEFLEKFKLYEIEKGSKPVLYFDERSKAFYLACHLTADSLVQTSDLAARLDVGDDDEAYKLNRDVTEDQAAFRRMEEDAAEGRSFEDLVVEYDTSYREEKPLKVYGGQHRVQALMNIWTKKNAVHGVRVYFSLSRDQKVEIATINNTSIAVPNDLLDRMREQLLGSELRDWCQRSGLLKKGQDFSDRRSPELPTVRVARTLVVNFFMGKQAKLENFHQPVICKSGGMDEAYQDTHKLIDWNDENLLEMGKQFARLHDVQRERVSNRKEDKLAEFVRKALSMTVVASWSYAAGLFQNYPEHLKVLYGLADSVSAPNDPLNAKALSQARHQGTDPDTYRGLGARSTPAELGRMLEVFLVLATKATKKKVTKELANAAIQSYEAKKATFEAGKALGRI